MSRIADRNLLWGVLALQLDFITRDALVDALTAWASAKHRDIEDILAERGALKQAHRAALGPLFALHVEEHGGDPARSLAALFTVGPVREAMVRVDDPDVQASLGHVGASRVVFDSGVTATFVPRDLPPAVPTVASFTSPLMLSGS